ncbi:uncharacterized membrane protein YbaN (DUF454 family) [Dysgonomonas sp. PH5-45]|uniref:YbaN family protein n=1 Tax=unclassified Dysgonomonas TaxID=2630389 RepID=UPI0024746A88|nr:MULTISPECIES: YbaN family protein [unclassified Dysgonomonas]MDH6355417.1 uncharacterized membrane protein YbaN (DUF454 family) [Dysgonomonas sp. PH5-45]MDH6388314.1 uncharacterized membrane protein YbaN (DUF454 family) [Dysgonomonas sp. PH5-37]
MKYIFIILGSISLMLGLLGIITPGLPTTPFILLTGILYTKGSPRLYKMLEENRLTGYYLKRLDSGFGWKAIFLSVLLMWCMVCFSAFVVFRGSTMQYVMLGLGAVGTIFQILTLCKKRKAKSGILTEVLPNNENETNL